MAKKTQTQTVDQTQLGIFQPDLSASLEPLVASRRVLF